MDDDIGSYGMPLPCRILAHSGQPPPRQRICGTPRPESPAKERNQSQTDSYTDSRLPSRAACPYLSSSSSALSHKVDTPTSILTLTPLPHKHTKPTLGIK